MPLHDSTRLSRATALRVVLPPPHDREIILPPLTLRQIAQALQLDPKADAPPETEAERLDRIFKQAEILLGEHAGLAGELTPDQIAIIVSALYLSMHGVDPTDYLAVQALLREQRDLQRTAEQTLAQVDDLVLALAAELRATPAAAEAMPMQDAVALYERLGKLAKEKAEFQIALAHGR